MADESKKKAYYDSLIRAGVVPPEVSYDAFNLKIRDTNFAKIVYSGLKTASELGIVKDIPSEQQFNSVLQSGEFPTKPEIYKTNQPLPNVGATQTNQTQQTTSTTTTETEVVSEEETPQQGTPARRMSPIPQALVQKVQPQTNQPQPTPEETQIAPIDQQAGQVQGGMPQARPQMTIPGMQQPEMPVPPPGIFSPQQKEQLPLDTKQPQQQQFQWSGMIAGTEPQKPQVSPVSSTSQMRISAEEKPKEMALAQIHRNAMNQGELATLVSSLSNPTPESIQRIAQINAEMENAPQSEAMQNLQKEGSFANMLQATPEVIYQSLASMIRSGYGTILGSTAAGAAVGSTIPVLGTLAGTGYGLGTGMVAAGSQVEYASSLMEGLRQQGVNVSDPNELSIAFSNPNIINNARKFAAKRTAAIMVFDAATMGVAGKLGVGRASSTLGNVARLGGELGIQATGGSAGEAFAQFVSGQEINPQDIIMEGLGELGGAPGDIFSAKLRAVKSPEQVQADANRMAANAPMNAEQIDAFVNTSVEAGFIAPDNAEQAKTTLNKANELNAKIPAEIKDTELRVAAIGLIEERDNLTAQLETVDEAFKPAIQEKIKGINEQLQELSQIPQQQGTQAFFETNQPSQTNPLLRLPESVDAVMDKIDQGVLVSAESLFDVYNSVQTAIRETLANRAITPEERSATINILSGMLTDIDRANTRLQQSQISEQADTERYLPAVKYTSLPKGQQPGSKSKRKRKTKEELSKEVERQQKALEDKKAEEQKRIAFEEGKAQPTIIQPSGKTIITPTRYGVMDLPGVEVYFDNNSPSETNPLNSLSIESESTLDKINDNILISPESLSKAYNEVLSMFEKVMNNNALSNLEKGATLNILNGMLSDIDSANKTGQDFVEQVEEVSVRDRVPAVREGVKPLPQGQAPKGTATPSISQAKAIREENKRKQAGTTTLPSSGQTIITPAPATTEVATEAVAETPTGTTAEAEVTTTPQAGVVGGTNPALADVESTAKALEGVDISNIEDKVDGIVYHGTSYDIEKPTIEKYGQVHEMGGMLGKAVYYTPSKSKAEYFADLSLNKNKNGVKKIISGVLKAKNIISVTDLIRQVSDDILNKWIKNGGKYKGDATALKKRLDIESSEKSLTIYLSRFGDISELARMNGNDAVTWGYEGRGVNEIAIVDDSLIETNKQRFISEAYHSAKAKPESERTAQETELITQVEQLLTPTQDAVQKQTASQVPVQSGTTSSQEVAKGEPQAEPQSTADKGQAQATATQEEVGTTPAEVASSEIANISDKTSVRDLASMQEGEVSAGVFSELNKGDKITIRGNEYVVTTKTKGTKKTEFKNKKGEDRYYTKSTITLKKVNKDGSLGSPISGTLVEYSNRGSMFVGGNAWQNLSRDIEGDITVDLINENNKFHEPSQSFKLAQQYVDKINAEVEKQQASTTAEGEVRSDSKKEGNDKKIAELEKEKLKLTSRALNEFPNSPKQLKTRARIDEINAELKTLKSTPEKVTGETTATTTEVKPVKKTYEVFRGQDEDYEVGVYDGTYGKGKYYTGDRKSAKVYGKNVTSHKVELSNPFIIKGTRVPGVSLEGMKDYINENVIPKGYDGVILLDGKGNIFELVKFETPTTTTTTTTEVTLNTPNETTIKDIEKIENATEKGRELALSKPVNKWVKRAFDSFQDLSSRAKKAGIYDGTTLKIGGKEYTVDTPAKFKAFLAQSQANFDAINEAVDKSEIDVLKAERDTLIQEFIKGMGKATMNLNPQQVSILAQLAWKNLQIVAKESKLSSAAVASLIKRKVDDAIAELNKLLTQSGQNTLNPDKEDYTNIVNIIRQLAEEIATTSTSTAGQIGTAGQPSATQSPIYTKEQEELAIEMERKMDEGKPFIARSEPFWTAVKRKVAELRQKLDSPKELLNFVEKMIGSTPGSSYNRTRELPLGRAMEQLRGKARSLALPYMERISEALKPIENNLSDFEKYLIYRRIIDRNQQDKLNQEAYRQGLLKDKPKRRITGGMTETQADILLNKLANKVGPKVFNQFIDAGDNLQVIFDDNLKDLVDAGVLTQDRYNAIKSQNEFYVPFDVVQRDFRGNVITGTEYDRSTAQNQSVIKRIEGMPVPENAAKADEFIGAVYKMMEKGEIDADSYYYLATNKITDARNAGNITQQEYENLMDLLSEPGLELHSPLNKTLNIINASQYQVARQGYMNDIDMLVDADKNNDYFVRLEDKDKLPSGMSVITYYKDGVQQRVAVDTKLKQAIDGMTKPELNAFQQALKIGSIPFRVAATSASITFLPVNFVIDTVRTLTSKAGLGSGANITERAASVIQIPVLYSEALVESVIGNLLSTKLGDALKLKSITPKFLTEQYNAWKNSPSYSEGTYTSYLTDKLKSGRTKSEIEDAKFLEAVQRRTQTILSKPETAKAIANAMLGAKQKTRMTVDGILDIINLLSKMLENSHKIYGYSKLSGTEAGVRRGLDRYIGGYIDKLHGQKKLTQAELENALEEINDEVLNNIGSPNFEQIPPNMRAASILLPFFGAAVKGNMTDISRMLNSVNTGASKKERKDALVFAARNAAVFTIPAFMTGLAMALKDDDDEVKKMYDEMDENSKWKNMIIPIQRDVDGEGVQTDFITIPVRGLPVVFNSIGRASGQAFGESIKNRLTPEEVKAITKDLLYSSGSEMMTFNLADKTYLSNIDPETGERKETRKEEEWVNRSMSAISGLNPLIKVFLERVANKNFFGKYPLFPENIRGKRLRNAILNEVTDPETGEPISPSLLKNKFTPEYSVNLSKKLERNGIRVTPITIDHFFDTFLAGAPEKYDVGAYESMKRRFLWKERKLAYGEKPKN